VPASPPPAPWRWITGLTGAAGGLGWVFAAAARGREAGLFAVGGPHTDAVGTAMTSSAAVGAVFGCVALALGLAASPRQWPLVALGVVGVAPTAFVLGLLGWIFLRSGGVGLG